MAAQKPVLLTFSGTAADMWTGYPADVARRVEDRFYWQPVNYPAVTFPMGPSVDTGVREAVRLITTEHDEADAYALCGYSQGGLCASLVLDEFRNGALKHKRDKLIAGVTFGNPARELDSNGGRGISDRRITNTPEWWVEEWDPMDIYANVPDNDIGEDMTSLFELVQWRSIMDLLGPDSLFEQVSEILTSPLREFPALVAAIIKGLVFFGSKPATVAHTSYHVRETVPGVTYLEHAVDHLRRAA